MGGARAVLRQLIRTVDRNLTSQSGNDVWKQAVYQEFRHHAGESDPERATQLIQEAADFVFHIESVRAHKVNLDSTAHMDLPAPCSAPMNIGDHCHTCFVEEISNRSHSKQLLQHDMPRIEVRRRHELQ